MVAYFSRNPPPQAEHLPPRPGCSIITNNYLKCPLKGFSAFCPFLYRDATNEMALHFLAKMKILVVQDIERTDVEFICRVSEW